MRVLALTLLYLFSATLLAAEPIGRIKTFRPEVTITAEAQTRQVAIGEAVYNGDRIVTSGSGSIGIIFIDGAVMTLGPSSTITLDQLTFNPAEKDVSFISTLIKGTMSFISGAIGRIAPQSVKIKTPTATLGLRGTKILVEVK